jgi:hypothetical protein
MTNQKTLRDALMFAFNLGRDYARTDEPNRQANIVKRLTDSPAYWAKQIDDSETPRDSDSAY